MNKVCQDDFKLCSLVVYWLTVNYLRDLNQEMYDVNKNWLKYLPVKYCGGNMEFGRVFSINMCSFPSKDSIVGFRNKESETPQIHFKVLKGLDYIGTMENWTLFKLNPFSTDDMTAMLYSPLEKNFTIEFAHFPHDSYHRILYRWVDC